jgi:hypothetical protein
MQTVERKAAVAAYAATAAISILAAVSVLELWKADLRVPFEYQGDGLLFSLIVKSVVDHGWTWWNPSVGAPLGLSLQDYPVSVHDSLHLLVIRLMALASGDWALLFNVYFLLGFPLIALSAMAVFRRFGVAYLPAAVGAVLYAFLPSRLLKGEQHLFLDVFFQVPLAALLLLWVCGHDPPLTRDGVDGRWPRLDWRRGRSRAALVLCAVIATTSLYYAFFTVCLLLGAGVWGWIERRSKRSLTAGLLLATTIVAGLGLGGLPTMIYRFRHGPNPEVAQRHSWEAEVFGLKVTQLLLPVEGHRLPALARLKQAYEASAPLGGEGETTSLGLVGSIGFLVLLGVVLAGRRHAEIGPDDDPWHQLRPLAALTLMAVLLGTVGGFGSLVALFITPQIRTYSRLNVLIGFFSLFAVVLLLDRLRRRHPQLGDVVLLVVFAIGVFDQATLHAARPYAATKREYASDGALVRRMEAVLPAGTAVFELPFSTFPEPPSLERMSGYDPLRPYLHTRSLRWSYPVMRGRGGDEWIRQLSQRDPESLLEGVSDADFGGVLIDRDGYPDGGSAIEAALRRDLGRAPMVSASGRLSFFSLADYNRLRHGAESSEAAARRRTLTTHPLVLNWGAGFYEMERELSRTFRWSEARSALLIENDTPAVRQVSLGMTLAAAQPPAQLMMDGDLLSADIRLVDGGVRFARTIDVPPGRHLIRFVCSGKRANAPNDPRTMFWMVENFTFDEALEALP